MDRLKRSIMTSYRSNHLWKLMSDEHFNGHEVQLAYGGLREAGAIPPPEKDFTFVSPSANVPTHELGFFREDQKTRKGKSLFLVGDICDFPLGAESIRTTKNGSVFQYLRWDAEQLPLKPETADMIWDRKGWLWHAARDLTPRPFFLALHRYYEILKPGGSLVLDHAPQEIENQGRAFEPSTVQMIRRFQVPKNDDLEETVRMMFSVKVVGSGIGRMNVLQKRTAEETARIAQGLTKV